MLTLWTIGYEAATEASFPAALRAAKIALMDGVRGFMALLGDSDVEMLACTGGFTRDSEDEVLRQETRGIMLLDSKRLVDLWTQLFKHIPEAQRRLLPLRPVYCLASADSATG